MIIIRIQKDESVIMNRHLEPDEDYGDDCHYYDDDDRDHDHDH